MIILAISQFDCQIKQREKFMKLVIKRCVDELGRIVLPEYMRSHYGIITGDVLEIKPTENGILIKKSFCDEEKEN